MMVKNVPCILVGTLLLLTHTGVNNAQVTETRLQDTNDCASGPCLNGGTCNDDRINGYTCSCVAGLTGMYCEKDIDECASEPCQNGATCMNAVNFYYCICALGYTGTNCEISPANIAVCPDGSPPLDCTEDPCTVSSCEGFPEAECRTNYCTDCSASFYHNNTNELIDCKRVFKIGECPASQQDSDNVTLMYRDECYHDGGCSGLKKCCLSGGLDRCLDPIFVPPGCFVNGKFWPVGTIRLWNCAVCKCLFGGYLVCLYPPGLICDLNTGPCQDGESPYTQNNQAVFCNDSPYLDGALYVDFCPKGHYCNAILQGYSVCCPQSKGCYYNGQQIPDGTEFLDRCAFCRCLDGAVTCHIDGLLCNEGPCIFLGPVHGSNGLVQWCSSSADINMWPVETSPCPKGTYCKILEHGYGVCCPLLIKLGCWLGNKLYPTGSVVIWNCRICRCYGFSWICFYPPGIFCDPIRDLPYGYLGDDVGQIHFCNTTDQYLKYELDMHIVDRCPRESFCNPLDGDIAVCVRSQPVIDDGGCILDEGYLPNGGVILMEDCVLCTCINGGMKCISINCDGSPCGEGTPYFENGYGTIFCGSKIDARRIRSCPSGYVCTDLIGTDDQVCCPLKTARGCPCPRIPVDSFPVCLLDCDPCVATSSYICCIDEEQCPGHCVGIRNSIGYCEHDCKFHLPGDIRTEHPCTECTCTSKIDDIVNSLGYELEAKRIAYSPIDRSGWDCVQTECDLCPCPDDSFAHGGECIDDCNECKASDYVICCRSDECKNPCSAYAVEKHWCVHNCEYYLGGTGFEIGCKSCICNGNLEWECKEIPGCDTCIHGLPLTVDGNPFNCIDGKCPQGYFCQAPSSICCPQTECVNNDWTSWFDRDDPSGTGDWETVESLIAAYGEKMCSNIVAIEVQTVDGQAPESTDDVFLIYGPTGFVCRIEDQPDGRPCEDYKIRFCCEDEEGDQCCLRPAYGDCRNSIEKWYYDCLEGVCKTFKYSGCGGNANRFDSKKDCIKHCAADSCCLDPDPGPCEGYFPMWYFDPRNNTCQEFIYGGCHGNDNRYPTRQECESACRAFNKNITCDADRMTATISVEWLHEILPHAVNGPQSYHLNDDICVGRWRYVGGKEYYEFRTDLEACGTTSYEKPLENRIVYTNVVRSHRGTKLFELECCYETEYTIAPIHVVTNPCCILVTLHGFGTFNITATLYRNDSFTTIFNENEFPLMICDGVFICFGIRVELHDPSLELFVEGCYASESEDPHAIVPHYEMITDGCLDDATMIPYGTSNDLEVHFCWDAYDVVNRDDVEDGEEINLYIHCKVVVCKKNELGTRCSQGCVERKRRAIGDVPDDDHSTSAIITHGPVKKSKNCQG